MGEVGLNMDHYMDHISISGAPGGGKGGSFTCKITGLAFGLPHLLLK